MPRLLSRSLLFTCFLLVANPHSRAQITNVGNDQSTPIPGAGHDYIHMLSETVNPGNGSLSLRLALPMPKGRGLNVPFAFAYDSNGVHHIEGDGANDGGAVWLSNVTLLSQGGWSYSVPLLSFDSSSISWNNGGGSCSITTDYVFQDASGGRHALGLSTTNDGQGGDGDAACGVSPSTPAGDDFFRAATNTPTNTVNPAFWIADLDGTVFHISGSNYHLWGNGPNEASLPDWIEDRNGNKIIVTDNMTSTGANRGVFTYTDTLGRRLVSSSGFGNTGNTISLAGLSGAFTLTWGTVTASFSVNSQGVNNAGAGCQAPPAFSGSQSVITAITLPNQTTYQF